MTKNENNQILCLKTTATDLKILHELDINARMPCSHIGNTLQLPESVVRYRIERLQRIGILKGYVTLIDTQQLGFQTHILFFCLNTLFYGKQDNTLTELKCVPQIRRLVTLAGKYNLSAEILSRDVEELDSAIHTIRCILNGCIIQESWLIARANTQLTYPLLEQARDSYADISSADRTCVHKKLQHVDFQILEAVSTNARITTVQMARKTSTDAKQVATHLRQMVSRGLIRGFKPVIDMTRLGQHKYVVLFKLRGITKIQHETLLDTIKATTQAFSITTGVGNWHMQVQFYCINDKALEQAITHIIQQTGDQTVEEHTVLTVTQEHKCVFYPAGIGTVREQNSLMLNALRMAKIQ